MSWERRWNKDYYCRTVRTNGRRQRQYIGHGDYAKLACDLDQLIVNTRQQVRNLAAALRSQVEAIRRSMDRLEQFTDVLLRAAVAAGIASHRLSVSPCPLRLTAFDNHDGVETDTFDIANLLQLVSQFRKRRSAPVRRRLIGLMSELEPTLLRQAQTLVLTCHSLAEELGLRIPPFNSTPSMAQSTRSSLRLYGAQPGTLQDLLPVRIHLSRHIVDGLRQRLLKYVTLETSPPPFLRRAFQEAKSRLLKDERLQKRLQLGAIEPSGMSRLSCGPRAESDW